MKNIFLILLLTLGVESCSEDNLTVYDGGINSVYFAQEKTGWVDSINFSFAMYLTNDTIIPFRVQALGDMVDHDRFFKVIVDERSTATIGKHFDLLNEEYILPGKSRDAIIPLRIHRTDDLYDTIVSVTLKLVPNGDFHQLMSVKNGNIDILHKTLHFSSITVQPRGWLSAFLGYFSVAKFNLINNLLGFNPVDWYDLKVSVGEAIGAGTFMANYLNDRINTGNPADAIKDPDPKSERGYMTFNNVTIPAHYPDAR